MMKVNQNAKYTISVEILDILKQIILGLYKCIILFYNNKEHIIIMNIIIIITNCVQNNECKKLVN